MPDDNQQPLSVSEKSKKIEKFKILNEEISLEQGFYWSRFSTFATLHAGLFVLFGFREEFQEPLSIVATSLGLVWIYVQGASLWYVNRLKPQLPDVSKELEIDYPPHFFRNTFFSTTDVAILAPLGITIFWWRVFSGCACRTQIVNDLPLLLCSYFLIILIATTKKTTPAKPDETKK